MFAADVTIGLLSGAFGSIGAPWLTHKLGRTAKQADERRAPYARILAKAARLLDLSSARGRLLAGPGYLTARASAWAALDDAVTAADSVSSSTTRRLIEEFKTACNHAAHEDDKFTKLLGERGGPANVSLEDMNPAMHAWSASRAAYDALRDQVQRETRG